MITANDIKNLILDSHSNDISLLECNTGSAYIHNIRKFDAWIMKKTWTPFTTIGYEVKVSRQDFLSDEKWKEYLPFCNEFYFVTTGSDIIDKNELPKEAGLKYVSKNCKRLFTKKRTIYRDVRIPQEIFAYILMWRVNSIKAVSSSQRIKENSFEKKKEEWENWLKEKEYKNSWGLDLPKRINKKIEEWLEPLKKENYNLKNENEKLSEVKNLCKDIGLPLTSYNIEYNFKRKIEELEKTANLLVHKCLEEITNNCTKIKESLKIKWNS